ncbi:response regulator [Aliiglaciecola sp. M165]|uniref:response regulator n=1 Tax=Aliiglaciecola sp. M165 TaxID=2593649 RepID=UPI001180DB2E|nr:response regulator [Aliiglaciecola sp. M165]TRY31909.1 response regulator [Aliiglaciecola sp. M165]
MPNYNVVIIDDDPISLEMLCYAVDELPQLGCIAFDDSFDAYQYFCAADSTDVDLVISDWKMPMLDGLELFNVFKKKFPTTPYLLVTAALTTEADNTIKGLGIDALISKPFSASAVKKKIQEVINC